MRIINETKLDFCDVLIQPKRSDTASRSDVSLIKSYHFKNSKQSWAGTPLVASNMVATGTMAMADALTAKGQSMITCLHKHHPEDKIVPFFKDNRKRLDNVFYTLGASEEELQKYRKITIAVGHGGELAERIRLVCVDIANGYSKNFVDYVKRVRDVTPHSTIMAGNVVTPEMVQELLISGAADIVKIGIGSGSVCTTRIITGVGYPQLSAVMECADAAHGLGGHVCSDGGCTTPGDVAKAFAAGADFVMLGGMLAGHDECEGEWVVEATGRASTYKEEKKEFRFFGMSSKEAADQYSGGLKDYRAAEGKCVSVPYRGSVVNTIQQITGGLRSACAYTGARSLKDLPKCTTFIKVNRTHNQVFG